MLKDRKTKLAASFVVTVSALAGCRKQTIDTDPVSTGRDVAYVNRHGDRCTMGTPEHCPKGASCNPPPPTEIDCPASLLDAGEPPQGPSARPPGKEDWLRVQPIFSAWRDGCYYRNEKFCAGPPKPFECTEAPPDPVVKCKPLDPPDAGNAMRFAVESFVYKDGLGVCHTVPAFECQIVDCSKSVPPGVATPCPP